MNGEDRNEAFGRKFQHETPSVELAVAPESIQQLDRNFSLLSISAVGVVTGNTWAALGGSIVSTPRSQFPMYFANDRWKGCCHIQWVPLRDPCK